MVKGFAMNEQLANLVHHVIGCGLNLRERLEKGEKPRLETEQTLLRRLLLSEQEAQRWSEFGSDETSDASAPSSQAANHSSSFLGVRYALTCWLDELFVRYSPWGEAWKQCTLETALFGSSDGPWRFWQQAAQAERRPTTDALEAFYLCVMLGFRGNLSGAPDKLQAWANAVKGRITRSSPNEWPHPPELQSPTNVPPLGARDSLRQVILLCAAALFAFMPVAVLFIVQQSNRP
jgi:type VI secretion system protein ImpK